MHEKRKLYIAHRRKKGEKVPRIRRVNEKGEVVMPDARLKIGDLVSVPPISLVIQLRDADSPQIRKKLELLETFVFTGEIESHFRVLLSSLIEPKGTGSFLIGHYGSGKSHFLSFFSLLLEDPENFRFLPESLAEGYGDLLETPFLVAKVPLLLFSGDVPLDEIVATSLERELKKVSSAEVHLSERRRLLENFNRFILPVYEEFLREQKMSREEWLRWCEEKPSEAVRLVREYLDSLEDNPLRLYSDRSVAFARLEEARERSGRRGIVMVLDELSEFLRSKPNNRSFTEDVRFLQFLGEHAVNHPFWILASLQEEIEETGQIEKDLYKRIKDRYPNRFRLTSRHIGDLIEKRVLPRKANAPHEIRKVLKGLKDSFPDLKESVEKMERIYPLHPSTLVMLENLMSLFSRHRGVVDFIHSRIGGDPRRKIPGMLDLPAEMLLTPDAIFDHFEDRIRESAEFAPYYNIVFKFLAADIPRIFVTQRERDLAIRAVKVLILTALSPLERRKSARVLANLLSFRVSSLDYSVNYDFLKEAILDRLVSESSYIKREEPDSGLDTIYFVDLAADISRIINARTCEILRRVEEDERLWTEILRVVNLTYLPLTEFATGKPESFHIQWQNTIREGTVRLGDIFSLNPARFLELQRELQDSERDFLCLIGLPYSIQRQQQCLEKLFSLSRDHPFSRTVIAWLPREPDEAGRRAILDTYAHLMLRKVFEKEESDRREILDALDAMKERELPRLRELVVAAYYQGEWLSPHGKLKWQGHEAGYLPFAQVLSGILQGPLHDLFPLHRSVMPLSGSFGRHEQEKVEKAFFLTGRITQKEAETQGVLRIIADVLLPLGIAKRSGASYVFSPEPAKAQLLSHYVKWLQPGSPTALANIYMGLRKGAFGITKPLFNLITASLLHAGYLTPFKEGRLVRFTSVSQLFGNEIDELGEGKILDSEYQARLPSLWFLWKEQPLSPFNLLLQRQLWKESLEKKEQIRQILGKVGEHLERYGNYPSLFFLDREEILPVLSRVGELYAAIEERMGPVEGLKRILDFGRENADLAQDYVRLGHLDTFFREHLEPFQRLYSVLSSPQLHFPESLRHLSEKKQKLQRSMRGAISVLWDGKMPELLAEFESFFAEYRDVYSAEHDRFYADPRFDAWEEFRTHPEYRALEKFSRVFTISAEFDLVKVERLLQQAPKRCRRTAREELSVGVVCGCGFRLGEELRFPSSEELLELARRGIGEYLSALSAPEAREKVEVYLRGLRDVGKPEAASDLRRLLAFRSRPGRLDDLERLLSSELIEHLNRALAGRVLVLERDLDGLTEALAGRRFSLQRVREIFEHWLEGEGTLTPDVFIYVSSRKMLRPLDLREHYGEALQLVKEEGEDFLVAFWLAYTMILLGLKDSGVLHSRYRVDMTNSEEIMRLCGNMKAKQPYLQDIEFAERRILDLDMGGNILEEISLASRENHEILEILQNLDTFRFISREAALLLFRRVFAEPQVSFALEAIDVLKSLPGRNREWGHLEILRDALRILVLLQQKAEEKGLLPQYTGFLSPSNFLLDKIRSRNFQEDFIPSHILQELESLVRRPTEAHRKWFEMATRAPEHDFPTTADFREIVFIPWRKKFPDIPALILIFDAMRWDIWEIFQEELAGSLPQHRMAQQWAAVALLPSTTPVNRGAFLGCAAEDTEGKIGGEEFVIMVAGERQSKRRAVREFLKQPVPVKVLHFSFIDDRIHHSRIDPYSLSQELLLELRSQVLPHFSSISHPSLIFIVSDHGFLYSGQKKEPFIHGGETPFERVIPLSVWVPVSHASCGC